MHITEGNPAPSSFLIRPGPHSSWRPPSSNCTRKERNTPTLPRQANERQRPGRDPRGRGSRPGPPASPSRGRNQETDEQFGAGLRLPNGGKGYGTAPGAPGDCFIGEAALRDLVTSRGGCGDFRPRRAATPTQSHADLACRWLAVARTRTRSPDRTDTSRQDRRRPPADKPLSPLRSTRALGRQPLGL